MDLVREMFRIAAGEPLGYDDPATRGHSFEFRINAEDAGRSFMPAPGTLTAWRPPSGPGVRVDEGYLAGMTVPSAYDSLVAKIIVTGADRDQALQRSRRALAETVLEGMPSVLPFHRAVLDEPAFTAPDGVFGVHTRWIETEFGSTDRPLQRTGRDRATDRAAELRGGGGRPPAAGPAARRPGRARPETAGPALASGSQGRVRQAACGGVGGPDRPDAGNDRHRRGRRGRRGHRGRPGGGTRGDEDGTTDRRAQIRDGAEPESRTRRDESPAERCCAPSSRFLRVPVRHFAAARLCREGKFIEFSW